MADAELMYRPATELAAMVRDGEISAQELVTCSLERIEALPGFVHVAAQDGESDGEMILSAEVGP